MKQILKTYGIIGSIFGSCITGTNIYYGMEYIKYTGIKRFNNINDNRLEKFIEYIFPRLGASVFSIIKGSSYGILWPFTTSLVIKDYKSNNHHKHFKIFYEERKAIYNGIEYKKKQEFK